MNNSKVWLFVFQSKIELDHMLPVIWYAATKKRKIILLMPVDYALECDFRYRLISNFPSIICQKFTPLGFGHRFFGKFSRIFKSGWFVSNYLKKEKIGLAIFEWGGGPKFLNENLFCRLKAYLFSDYITQLKNRCFALNIPLIAFPHGHSTKTSFIRNDHVISEMEKNNGLLPFSDRDAFAAYIFYSHYHKDALLNNSDMNGKNICVWGAPRFSLHWITRLYEVSPSLTTLKPTDGQKKVVFFLPKWQNLIDRKKTIETIIEILSLDEVQLVIKGHARQNSSSLNEEELVLIKMAEGVVVEDTFDSTSLIKWCDILIDVDSSIALDAILLGKVYIRPKFLQDSNVAVIYTQLGGAYQPNCCGDLMRLLMEKNLTPAFIDPNFVNEVIGGDGEMVLQKYFLNMTALTNDFCTLRGESTC